MLSLKSLAPLLLSAAFLSAQAVRAPESQSPPPSPADIRAGKQTYSSNCAFCHGVNVRGGAQGGPNLTESALVRSDRNGKQLGAFLKVGRPNKGMPAFNLPAAEVESIAAFLDDAAASAARHPDLGSKILVGDPAAGEAFFDGEGNCTHCHSVRGDLRGIASRYSPVVLQGRIVLPRGDGGYPGFSPAERPTTHATVTLPNGRIISGLLLFISDYNVTILDASGLRHTIKREGDIPKLSLQDSLQAHLDRQLTLTDKQMHDLTAYLATL